MAWGWRRLVPGAVACGILLLLSGLLLWPLPLHFRTHVPGDPSGDLGVYVWNLWIFRHELLDHARSPFSTDHLFAFTRGADFSLHNYTPIAGLLGVPLMGWLGVVGTFNAVLIALVGLSGAAMAGLGRRLGLGWPAATAAAGLFMAAPVITARESAHLSLVITGALPLFLWALLRVLDSARVRDAAAVGAAVALASYSDAYFGIYCGLMGLFIAGWRFVHVDLQAPTPAARGARRWRRALDGLVALMLLALVARVGFNVQAVAFGPVRASLQTLYTPVLVIVIAVALRVISACRPRMTVRDDDGRLPRLAVLAGLAVTVSLVLLMPVLIGLAQRAVDGRLPGSDIFWRSSPRGVDLLAYLVPNPLHPVFGASTSGWLMPDRQDAFPEFVAGFSLVALTGLAIAWRAGVLPRLWVAFTAFFAALSLGPFVHVGGVNTLVPGPWAVLRFVPVLGMARAPSRFSIVAAMGLAVLCGFAVQAWLESERRQRAWSIAALIVVLAVELVPAPRRLYSAEVPEVYHLLADGQESAAVIELPTGIRDGTSSLGDFSASAQFFQTVHRRPLVGGYLSRVSQQRKDVTRRNAVMNTLITLSEPGGSVAPPILERARRARDRFLARTCVGFVVVDKQRASPALQAAAVDVLRLAPIHEDARYALFQPVDAPACAPREGAVRKGLFARLEDDPDPDGLP